MQINKWTFFNFNHNICEHLITPLQNSHPVWRPAGSRKTASKQNTESTQLTVSETVGIIDSPHMLLENLPRKKNPIKPQDVECYLCRQRGHELKTIYSCLICKKGFHVNCFAAFHFRGGLSNSHQTLLEIAFRSEKRPKITHGSSYCSTSLADMKLPQDKGRNLAKIRKRKKNI